MSRSKRIETYGPAYYAWFDEALEKDEVRLPARDAKDAMSKRVKMYAFLKALRTEAQRTGDMRIQAKADKYDGVMLRVEGATLIGVRRELYGMEAELLKALGQENRATELADEAMRRSVLEEGTHSLSKQDAIIEEMYGLNKPKNQGG